MGLWAKTKKGLGKLEAYRKTREKKQLQRYKEKAVLQRERNKLLKEQARASKIKTQLQKDRASITKLRQQNRASFGSIMGDAPEPSKPLINYNPITGEPLEKPKKKPASSGKTITIKLD